MKTGAIIVARLSSQRLPNKNMLEVLGMPMIGRLCERVAKARSLDEIIIATSKEESDDLLEEYADSAGIKCHRGSLDNVMGRIVGAARENGLSDIVEILGDNPLVHSEIIDEVIDFYFNGSFDYAANATNEYDSIKKDVKRFPIGLRTQVYSLGVAEKYVEYPEYPGNGRHPCAFIFDNPDRFNVGFYEAGDRWGYVHSPEYNFAVNYSKNLELVRRIFARNYPIENNFSLKMVFDQLNEEPELIDLLGAE